MTRLGFSIDERQSNLSRWGEGAKDRHETGDRYLADGKVGELHIKPSKLPLEFSQDLIHQPTVTESR